jgi:hypothetical protein
MNESTCPFSFKTSANSSLIHIDDDMVNTSIYILLVPLIYTLTPYNILSVVLKIYHDVAYYPKKLALYRSWIED